MGWLLLENCIVDASIQARDTPLGVLWVGFCDVFFVEVFKCTGWMPWHQEPKKDVVACDKPRGVGKQAVIRGCPNGGTQPQLCVVTRI